MNVKQAIQSSANVIRVTNITVGDVYKRFDESYDTKVHYGVVRNVHNDGEKAIVEALEYTKSYGGIDIEIKVIRGDKDYTLFPAEPHELNVELESVVTKKEKDIRDKKHDIVKLENEIADLKKLMSGEILQEMKAMSYTELSQMEYAQKRLESAV